MFSWKCNQFFVAFVVSASFTLTGEQAAVADVIEPGFDLLQTPPGATRVEFGGASGIPPIPADFFFPGSQPWSGVVELRGDPLPAYPGASVSAVIERKEPADPSIVASATIAIELVSLNLKSVVPILVQGAARNVDSFFDITVRLNPATASSGFMTITETTPGVGGQFTMEASSGGGIYAYARFNFFEAWPSKGVLPLTLDPVDPILLESDPLSPPTWQYAPPPLATDAGNNFYPAVDSFFDVLFDGGSSGIHVVSAATQAVIPIGNDYFRTRAGSTRVEFGGTSQIPPIPADFFCPGSPPWEGVVELQEEPIPAYALPVSTVAKKKQAATMPGPATIEVELIELSLKSVAPITVPCPTGDSFFDIFVTLNPNQPSTGFMTITETTPGVGGQFTFDSASGGGIYVYARFNFFEAWPSKRGGISRAFPQIVWDPLDPILLESDPLSPPSWQYEEPEAVIDAGNNFYPAVDSFFDVSFDGGSSGIHVVSAATQAVIPVGRDYFTTPAGSTRVEFGGTSQIPPIPADFFCPGSPPWEGTIDLRGDPLPGYPGATVSTVIERRENAVMPGPATIEIEMVELSLHSVAPITVQCAGRNVDSFFDITVTLNPATASTGFMTIEETTPGVGGQFTMESGSGGGIYLYARFNFFEAWPSKGVLPLTLDPLDPVLLESNPLSPPTWQYAAPPLATNAGNNFYPAVDSFFDVLSDGGSSGIHLVSAATQVVIPVGNDYFKTRAGSTRVEFGGTSQIPPIPADFFCPGSLPWEGVVELQEEPIPAYSLPVSTVAKKKQAATMPGPATIEVELVELSLKSVAPITVQCPGPRGRAIDSFFDITVGLNPNQLSTGLMTITETTPGVGGQFSFNAASGGGIYVYARFNFFEAWPSKRGGISRALPQIVWDPLDPILLESDPSSPPIWQYDEPEAAVEVGHNFYPAVDSFFDITFDGGLSGQHGVIAPPPPPPPDYHASPPNLSWVIFDQTGDVPPTPADFFGPGSDPFQGQVDLEGDPIDQATLGGTSTILQRSADPVAPGDPVGAAGAVDIELVALSLRSTQPITVTYDGGMTPEDWNVHVGLSPTAAPVGSLSATKTHANGGTYDVTIHVQPLLTFTRVSDGMVLMIDTAAQGEGPYELQGSGNFVHAVDSFFDVLYDIDAQWVGGIEETIPGDTTSQVAEEISVEPLNGLRWLVHGIVPPPPPPQYCPLPDPPDDWCQQLQTSDCLTTSTTTTCLPQSVQIDGAGTPIVETCQCFEPGGCGAVQIAPAGTGDFTLSCPGTCATPEVCQIHLDGQPLGQTSVNASAVAGALVTCGCAGPPICQPNIDGSACTVGGCSAIPEDLCLSTCMNFDPATGATTITACDCINGFDPVDCHVEASPIASDPCVVADPTGLGTVTLPPIGCDYLSPNEVHAIIDGLPPGTTIELDPIHMDFICPFMASPLCSLVMPPDLCEVAGGSLGGNGDCFDSTLDLTVRGTGSLAGFNRHLAVPIFSEVHTGPRNPGDPVQTFPNDMYRLQGELFGDPDFCTFRVTGGTDYGLPSPGQTTLTQLPGGSFAVDSFFDITYQIEFQGCPGSILDGYSGTTTATIRMETSAPDPPTCVGDCPLGTVCEETQTPNPDGTVDICCDCVSPLPDPQPAGPPYDRRMNRIIAWDPNTEGRALADPIAYQVELKQITQGSCDGSAGGPDDFCREGKWKCSVSGEPCTLDIDCPLFPVETCSVSSDCNTCSATGGPCINQPIDCTGGVCTPTGETCVNDAPNVGGTNVGKIWWVGPECPAGSGQHLLVSEIFRKEATNWPVPTLAGDCEVAPQTVYGVRAYNVSAGTFSDELSVETTLFAPISSSYYGDCVGPLQRFCAGDIHGTLCVDDGDCTPPETCDLAWTLPEGAVNFDDVTAGLWAWGTPPGKTIPPIEWVDLHGNASGAASSEKYDPPNHVINAGDLQAIILGFSGRPYGYYDPADCPDPAPCASR